MHPVILAGGAILAALGLSKYFAGPSSAAPTSTPGPTVDVAALRARAETMVREGRDPDSLDDLAKQLEKAGVADLALRLHVRAAALRGPGAGPRTRIEANMDASLKAKVTAALSKATDPDELESLAEAVQANGYPNAAALLRDRATSLRLEKQADKAIAAAKSGTGDAPPPAKPKTWTIKGNAKDVSPSALAKTVTGTANRWKELLDANPDLKVETEQYGDGSNSLKTRTKVVPWNAGQTVNLPAAWQSPAAQ